ncbi:hypothetical protein DFH06DRAFT_698479 [Mycena polygramma]|nr:hypothetical protein DFH06DRAFT_698479 [Mycena polygramma]
MHPRPILKALPEPALADPPLPSSPTPSSSHPLPFAACSTRGLLSTPHVHFPATPGLALTADAYSPGTYDRAPIAVQPNSCAMPERGGRVYGSPAVSASGALPKGSYFHPRAFEACEPEPVPPLLHDLSSDDSVEECVSPQSSSPMPGPRVAVRMQGTPYPTPIPRTHSQEEFDYALSFLPHPPAPVPQRELEKRRKSPRPRSVAFADSTDTDCDGCLGGF